MTLSLATFFLFIALTPGFFFLLALRCTPAKLSSKDVFESQTQEIIAFLLVSSLCSGIVLLMWIGVGGPGMDEWFHAISRAEAAQPLTARLFERAICPAILFAIPVYILSGALGWLLGMVYVRTKFFRHLVDDIRIHLYLPGNKKKYLTVVWVLTKTAYEGKNLLYIGVLGSIKFDYGTLEQVNIYFPMKTYVDLDSFLETKHKRGRKRVLPREVGQRGNVEPPPFIHIPKDSIANMYCAHYPISN